MGEASSVERYTRYDFLLPGVLLMTGGAFPVGTAERLGGPAPDLVRVPTFRPA